MNKGMRSSDLNEDQSVRFTNFLGDFEIATNTVNSDNYRYLKLLY